MKGPRLSTPSACKCPSSCLHDPNIVRTFQNLGLEGVPAWDPTASPHTPPCVCRPAISWTLDFLARMSVKRRVPLWWPLTTIPASFRKATVLTMDGEGSAVMTLPRSMSHTCYVQQSTRFRNAGKSASCRNCRLCLCWQGGVLWQSVKGHVRSGLPAQGPQLTGRRRHAMLKSFIVAGIEIVCVRAFVAALVSRMFCSRWDLQSQW